MNDTLNKEEALRLAKAVVEESRESITKAYEQGGLSGLCAEGRWDLALDALNSIKVERIVDRALDKKT